MKRLTINTPLSLTIISLSLLSLSNPAIAQINQNQGNRAGITLNDGNVAWGKNSVAQSSNGIASGTNAVATGNNISRSEFLSMLQNYNGLLQQRENLQNQINAMNNNLNTKNGNINRLRDQINTINNQLAQYGNNLNRVQALNNQKSNAENDKNNLVNQINTLSSQFNNQREFVTFYEVLRRLNWSELQQANGIDKMGEQLKQKVASQYPNIASQYSDNKYRDIVQGYINVETLLTTTVNDFNSNVSSSNMLRREQNNVLGYDAVFFKNGVYSNHDSRSNYDPPEIKQHRIDRPLFYMPIVENGKLNQDYINYLTDNSQTAEIRKNFNQSVTGAVIGYMKQNDGSNQLFPYLNKIVNNQTLSHTSQLTTDITAILDNPSIYRRSGAAAERYGDQPILLNTDYRFPSATYKPVKMYVTGFIDDLVEKTRNPLMTQNSNLYEQYLKTVNRNIAMFEQLNMSDNPMVQDMNQTKAALMPYYNQYRKEKEMLDLYFSIQTMPEGAARQQKQAEFLSLLESHNNGAMKQNLDNLRNNSPISQNGTNKIQISDNMINYIQTNVNNYKNYLQNLEPRLLGYDPNDELITKVQREAQNIKNNLDQLNRDLDNKNREIDRLTQAINQIDVSTNETQLNNDKQQKEQELADALRDKQNIEHDIQNQTQDLNNKINQLRTALQTSGSESIAHGNNAFASGLSSISIGADSTTTGNYSTAYGKSNNVTAEKSHAIGYQNTINGKGNMVFGNDNQITSGENNVVVGNQININGLSNTVVLGNNSTARASNNMSSLSINGTNYNFAGATTQSVVSVGKAGEERQIINVGAGQVTANSTDAINGSQLHGTIKAIEGLSENADNINVNNWRNKLNIPNAPDLSQYIKYDSPAPTDNTVTLRPNTKINNVGDGAINANSKEAVNGSQLFALQQQVNSLPRTGGNPNAVVYTDNSKNTVNLGGANGTTITNLKAGNISQNSTDAVNGSQLHAVQEQINKGLSFAGDTGSVNTQLGDTLKIVGGNNITTTIDPTSKTATVGLKNDINVNSVASGGYTVNGSTVKLDANGLNNGDQKVTNVADGTIAANSKDAINGGQLHALINNLPQLNQINITPQVQSNTQRIQNLENRVTNLDERMQNAVAASNAIGGMVQATEAGNSLVGISIGGYGNKQAIAIGVSGLSDNGRIIYKLNGATNITGDQKFNYSGSIGLQF